MLGDPAVQAAVLELPRKGLIYLGHPCDRYDVAALLNVQDDHVGVDGDRDAGGDMAELKAEVLERATRAVWSTPKTRCVLRCGPGGHGSAHSVARSPDVDAVVEHRRRSGEAVFLDQRDGRPWIILATGDTEEPLMPVHDIPATMNGLLAFSESNAMFAAAVVAWAQGIDTGIIRRALGCFNNTADENPGATTSSTGCRSTWSGLRPQPRWRPRVCSLVSGLPVAGRRVLCNLIFGTRRSAVLDELAPRLASTFDDFVLGCDLVNVDASPDYGDQDPAGAMLARYRQALLKKRVDASRILRAGPRDRDPPSHSTRPGPATWICPAGRLRWCPPGHRSGVPPIPVELGISQPLTPGHPWDD